MIGKRIQQRLEALRITQSELARRTKLNQSTINGLVRGAQRSSVHLHRIAVALQTTPAFLEGDTDDPSEGAPPPPPAPHVQFVLMPVALPSENALARMFLGLLDVVDLSASKDALAEELAQLLPTALTQMQGPLIEWAAAEPVLPAEAAAALAIADREPTR